MRGAAVTLFYLFCAVVFGISLSWLLMPWLHGVLGLPAEKVLSRSILLVAAAGLVLLWRWAGLSAAALGLWPAPRQPWLKAYLLALLAILPPMLFFLAVGFRVPDPDTMIFSTAFAQFLAVALLGSCLLSVFEETLFRGVLYTYLLSHHGVLIAGLVSSLLYAVVHFVEPDGGAHLLVDGAWVGGWRYTGAALAGLFQPSLYWDSFLSLFMLGVLFAYLRHEYGLWTSIACHAAWVFALRLFKELTARDILNSYQPWTGSFDNFMGHLVTVWLLLLLLVLARHSGRFQRLPGG
ncbi:MAG: CPBP family intramembrane glutamic endopeptidase [Pseudomonadota bacterium]